MEGSGPTLLGRDWLSQIQLDWRAIHHVHTSSLQAVLARYPSVFKDGLGTLQGFKAIIYVDPNAKPSFNPASSIPYALRDLVDKELERLQSEGTLEPVEISEWEAPIVVVLKRDRPTVRFCGDFSVTVNPVKVVCIICTITSAEICIIESQSWIDTQFRKSRICLHG